MLLFGMSLLILGLIYRFSQYIYIIFDDFLLDTSSPYSYSDALSQKTWRKVFSSGPLKIMDWRLGFISRCFLSCTRSLGFSLLSSRLRKLSYDLLIIWTSLNSAFCIIYDLVCVLSVVSSLYSECVMCYVCVCYKRVYCLSFVWRFCSPLSHMGKLDSNRSSYIFYIFSDYLLALCYVSLSRHICRLF